VTYVIAEPRIDVKDKSCVEECPVDCICEGERMLDTSTPANARLRCLRARLPGRGDLLAGRRPGQRARFTAGNATFFDQLGSPGRRRQTGPLPYDTEYVAGYIVTGR